MVKNFSAFIQQNWFISLKNITNIFVEVLFTRIFFQNVSTKEFLHKKASKTSC